jgi:hypothetical protein
VAIAYGDLTSVEYTFAARIGAGDPLATWRQADRSRRRNTALTTSAFGGKAAAFYEWFNGVEIVCC